MSADGLDWVGSTLAFSLLVGSFLLIATLVAFRRKRF